MICHKDRALQCFQQCVIINVGIGIMDKYARVYVTVCIDMEITSSTSNTSTYIFCIILEIHTENRLGLTEFTDLITISQMTPGPIAINAATFVGMKLTGMPGAVVATLGYITPSCIIVTIIAKLYLKYREMDMLQGILGGIRPAVVALIGSAGISILQTAFWGVSGKMVISDTSWLMVGIFVVCVILLRKVKMNPIWVMVLAGVMKVLVAMAGKI